MRRPGPLPTRDMPMDMLTAMRWRYATKTFDAARALDDDSFAELLESVRLAPSSFGLQPFRLLVVGDPFVRARIRTLGAFGQPQVTDASRLIVFAAETDVDASTVGRYVDRAAATWGAPRETLSEREAKINQRIGSLSPGQRVDWAQKQAYLALGVLVSTAASAGIDVSSMEGFDAAKVDDILRLDEQGLTSTVLAAVGFRSAKDAAAKLAKVRKPKADLVSYV